MRLRTAIRLSFALLLLASLVQVALAADNAPVLGNWTVSFTMQDQPVEATLEIKEADGALSGTWTSPRGTDTLGDVKWDGQQLTFSRTVNRQGQEFKIEQSAKVTGDTMEGKMVLPQREIPFTGKRAA